MPSEIEVFHSDILQFMDRKHKPINQRYQFSAAHNYRWCNKSSRDSNEFIVVVSCLSMDAWIWCLDVTDCMLMQRLVRHKLNSDICIHLKLLPVNSLLPPLPLFSMFLLRYTFTYQFLREAFPPLGQMSQLRVPRTRWLLSVMALHFICVA